jgi:hypothetical protein
VLVGGLTAEQWLAIWFGCHNMAESGPMQFAWPDGGTLLQQPAVTVHAFREVRTCVIKELQNARGINGN